jgi:hypothetical protein
MGQFRAKDKHGLEGEPPPWKGNPDNIFSSDNGSTEKWQKKKAAAAAFEASDIASERVKSKVKFGSKSRAKALSN